MKVGILTWHKALNHGAVLQAYASQQYINQIGYDAKVLDYKRKVINLKTIRQKIQRKFFKLINGELRYKKLYKNFETDKKVKFDAFVQDSIKTGKDCLEEECDAVMIGSDMVFNLLEGFNSYMFGYGLQTKYVFSYAACAGGSTIGLVKKLNLVDQIKYGLNNFCAIGCRDEHTKKFVEEISGRTDLFDNIDPVLLYGFEKEKIAWNSGKWKRHKPYILIYSYMGCMNEQKVIREIRKYADANCLDIISCGYYHPWCNDNVNADPCEFIEMFNEAAYVITDTFHGTVFSLINEKKFCSIISDNAYKLRHLLEWCGLTDRIAKKSSDINKILDKKIEYKNFRLWLAQEKEKSNAYIKQQLKNANELKEKDKS